MIGLGPACEHGAEGNKSKKEGQLGQRVKHLGQQGWECPWERQCALQGSLYLETAAPPTGRGQGKSPEPVQTEALDQKSVPVLG